MAIQFSRYREQGLKHRPFVPDQETLPVKLTTIDKNIKFNIKRG